MRVSSATGLPSATIEIQEVFSARMSRVNVRGGFAAAGGVLVLAGVGMVAAAGGLATGLWLVEPFGDAVGDAPAPDEPGPDAAILEDGGAPGRVGVGLDDVVSGEIVPGDSTPADSVPAEDGFPTVNEAAVPDGCVGVVAGVGAGDCFELVTGFDSAVASRRWRRFQKARSRVRSSKAIASMPHGIPAEGLLAGWAGSPAEYLLEKRLAGGAAVGRVVGLGNEEPPD